ncbi:MAG: hypothetical protein U0235_21210 [Polyangiaceae bacterium]
MKRSTTRVTRLGVAACTIAIAGGVTLGCRRDKSAPASVAGGPRASMSTSTSAAPPPVAPPKPIVVELLHSTPSMVAVSSSVKNQFDRPEGLVDGSLKTAWNSRPGDLKGAWIAFRVPEAVRIKAIKMTSGFVHRSGKDDLFAMNHRVRRVRIRNDTTVFGLGGAGGVDGQPDGRPKTPSFSEERALDPESRELQTLDVDLPGGDYVVEVLDVVAGSKKAWREVAISEFRVWGTPPLPRSTLPQEPIVRVASAHVDDERGGGLFEHRGVLHRLPREGRHGGGGRRAHDPRVSARGADADGGRVQDGGLREQQRGWRSHAAQDRDGGPIVGGSLRISRSSAARIPLRGQVLLGDPPRRAFKLAGTPSSSLLVATTAVETESGMEVTPDGARDFGLTSYRAKSHETTVVATAAWGAKTVRRPAPPRYARRSRARKAYARPAIARRRLARVVHRARELYDRREARARRTARSVSEEGPYDLEY